MNEDEEKSESEMKKKNENDGQEVTQRWRCYQNKKPTIAALKSRIEKDTPAKAVLFVQLKKIMSWQMRLEK